MFSDIKSSPLQELDLSLFEADHSIRLLVKRDDLLYDKRAPYFCGNKWRKLKYNLQTAREQGYSTLLTFGGAYSNHILATADAGKLLGFKTIGIIRGEEHLPLNFTLRNARDRGMQLHYLDRKTYRNKHSAEVREQLLAQFGSCYFIPEGGTNALALKGCAELGEEIRTQMESSTFQNRHESSTFQDRGTLKEEDSEPLHDKSGDFFKVRSSWKTDPDRPGLDSNSSESDFTFQDRNESSTFQDRGTLKEEDSGPAYIALSCGTGGTMAGLLSGLATAKTKVIGFSALKGDFLQKEIEQLLVQNGLTTSAAWQIQTNYHFGGYAKFKPELLDFIRRFKAVYGIQLDPVYTGKLFYGVFDLIQKGHFPKDSSIVVVHTGGLQGIEGFEERYGERL